MRHLFLAPAFLLAGCGALGPEYQTPAALTPQQYRAGDAGNTESPSAIGQADWWTIFADPQLNELEAAARTGSQQLKAAYARLQQARAVARASEAELWPRVNLGTDVARTRQTENRPIQPGSTALSFTSNRIRLPLDFSYEIDLWGRVERASEAQLARAQASGQAYRTAALSLHAEVAQLYFSLRALDSERALLRATIDFRHKALALINARFRGGVSGELDVARAETELATAQSEAIGLERRRADLEHALAALTGRNPSEFSLAESPLEQEPPAIPAGLPAELLQRRPDVIEAERLLAARSAEIGVAKGAFFPSIRLTGFAGFESTELSDLTSSGSRVWSFGPAVTLPLFDGGRNDANLERAKAAFDENLANYRQRILVAFQEVESALAALRILAEQAGAQANAVSTAQRTAHISNARYRAGLVAYLEVIDAERTALQNQRLAVQIRGQRLVNAVSLIKALGGGWLDGQKVGS
jgi:multidrug efflux system outer membrane protein